MKGILIKDENGTPIYGDKSIIKQICSKCQCYPDDCEWEDTECMTKYVDYLMDYKGEVRA